MSATGKQKNSKKTAYYVPSRYKQAAEKISNQSSISKERSIFLKSSRDSHELQLSGNVSQDTSSSSNSKFNSSGDSRGKTSTPTSKGELPLPLLDASAVTGDDGFLTVPHLKERIGPVSVDCVKRNLTRNFRPRDETRRPVIVSQKNDNYNEKLAEVEMDLFYTYYLQSVFLESEAKKALEARSSNAIETLHKLFTLVLQHLPKVKSKQCTLKIILSLIAIHEHCRKQEDILKPVFEGLPVFKQQYKSLAEAINTSKDRLHVKDIMLEPGYEGELDEILQKMIEFISVFFELLPSYKAIISSSNALKNYADASELINEDLKRGLSLLVEARDLCFSEASLTSGFETL